MLFKSLISLLIFLGLATVVVLDSSAASNALTVSTVMTNINDQIDYVKLFIIGISYLLGAGFCISAVMKLKKYGTRTAFMAVETSMLGPLLQFFIGVSLFYLLDLFKVINTTLYGESNSMFATAESVFNYDGTNQNSDYEIYITPIFSIVQIIGLISFLRGWSQLVRATAAGQSQPGSIPKGITHIVAGVLAVNIYQLINVFYFSIGYTS
ncbi:MAG: hypothetical protein VXY77_01690 [Pseudomonadota bacterium]|nr:hypothetical protein [Pseudomonadota bacterium]